MTDAKKGLFIVMEGIDGSGKSTQAEMLSEKLAGQGHETLLTAEPSKGKWGRKIREILGGDQMPTGEEQLELFLKDRADDAEQNILPALAAGKIIIMDRYWFSNAAYQGAMGLDPAYILEENMKRKFPVPDRVYFIDIPVETALERIGKRNRDNERDLFEKESFLAKVREIYLSLKEKGLTVIDGTGSPEEINRRIAGDLEKLLS